jgi:radical SAM protein (TIGR01212 family)
VHVPEGGIKNQVKEQINKSQSKGVNKFSVYFQSYSNTYGDIGLIVDRLNEALIDDRIVEISIGTRPDVVENDKLEVLKKRFEKYNIVIELGLQSKHNKTLELINRGHTFEDFDDAVDRIKAYGFGVCAHIILGLPYEDEKMMLETVKYVSDKHLDFVKFHHLHILKGTKLEQLYIKGDFSLLSEDEYIYILGESIKILDKDIVISRLVGDSPKNITVAPDWPESKLSFLNRFNQYLEYKNIWQGCGG